MLARYIHIGIKEGAQACTEQDRASMQIEDVIDSQRCTDMVRRENWLSARTGDEGNATAKQERLEKGWACIPHAWSILRPPAPPDAAPADSPHRPPPRAPPPPVAPLGCSLGVTGAECASDRAQNNLNDAGCQVGKLQFPPPPTWEITRRGRQARGCLMQALSS